MVLFTRIYKLVRISGTEYWNNYCDYFDANRIILPTVSPYACELRTDVPDKAGFGRHDGRVADRLSAYTTSPRCISNEGHVSVSARHACS